MNVITRIEDLDSKNTMGETKLLTSKGPQNMAIMSWAEIKNQSQK